MKITKITPATFGHLIVELENGVQQILHRGTHETLNLKVGDECPPVVPGELYLAPKASYVADGEVATVAEVPVDATVQVASHTEPDVATQLDAAPPAPESPAESEPEPAA